MIQYMAKHPELYPRYCNWSNIYTNEWNISDFRLFNVNNHRIVRGLSYNADTT